MLWLAVLCLFGAGWNTVSANAPYLKKADNTSINREGPWFDCWLHIGEDYGSNDSYWVDDPKIYIDDVLVGSFSELGIPTYSSSGTDAGPIYKSVGKLFSRLEAMRPYNGVYTTKQVSPYVRVCLWDPRYNGDDTDYQIRIIVHCGWNRNGKAHTLKVVGKWVNNGGSATTYTLTYSSDVTSVDVFPTSITMSRKNGKLVANWSGMKTYSGFNNQIFLYKSVHDKPKNITGENLHDKAISNLVTSASSGSYDTEVSNYTPYAIYPVVLHFKNMATTWSSSQTCWTDWVNDGYSQILVAAYPRATDVAVKVNDVNAKSFTVSWGAQFSSSEAHYQNKDGQWYVYRRPTGSALENTEILAKLPYDTRSYTYNKNDHDTPYEADYTYIVCFVPTGWDAPNEGHATDLWDKVVYNLHRDFTFPKESLVTVGTETDITFSWIHTSLTDASNSNPYTLTVERSTDKAKWTEVKSYSINSPEVMNGEYIDTDNLKLYETYYYRLKIYAQDQWNYSEIKSGSLAGASEITGFTATRGDYSNTVKLQWTVKQVGTGTSYFTVQRRPLGSTDASAWSDIYSTTGTANMYSYDDVTASPGSFYEYQVLMWAEYGGERKGEKESCTDGFCMTTGVLSGRIYYDSGTAVDGVKVSLVPSNADGASVSNFRSLRLTGGSTRSGMKYASTLESMQSLIGGNFTMQCYLNPNSTVMGTDGAAYVVASAGSGFQWLLRYVQESGNYELGCGTAESPVWSGTYIPADKWSHVSLCYSVPTTSVQSESEEPAAGTVVFHVTSPDTTVSTAALAVAGPALADAQECLALGNNTALDATNAFAGNVDEFRLFRKVLTTDEIRRNYNHTLTGSESDLAIYWPMDEGVVNQTVVYDFSRANGVINGRFARMSVPAASSTEVPAAEQLSLSAYTDANGNYLISGIPFSGEGVNYVITPTMGVHTFSPSNSSRYFSINSLVHSGIDFTDNSSFPVSGTIYYEGTTIPVEDAYIYVDGSLSAKDGEPVMTNDEGEFTVDVPIGDHFISVRKNGHEFLNGGRYPADPNGLGLRHTFDNPMDGLTFTDVTTVKVAGRVAGGSVEEAQPLGLGKGNANIGQAKITLTFPRSETRLINAERIVTGTAVRYEASDEQRDFTCDLNGGTAYVEAGKNVITILTDPETGEFAASLPPLRYEAEQIIIPSQPEIDFSMQLPTIDATNPQQEYTDSVKGDNGEWLYFTYNAAAQIIHRSPSHLDITENADGSFGMASYDVTDIEGVVTAVPLYTLDENDEPDYKFGYPVYQMLNRYTYDFHAYENYINKDGGEGNWVYTEVPVGNIEVTVKNEMAGSTSVSTTTGEVGTVVDNKFTLGEDGRAQYTFTCGLPNIQSPYTRGLRVSYEVNDQQIDWDGNGRFAAVVLGALPTGNNFVTNGPDKVLMVLRDPPGSLSSTTYAKGTSIASTTTRTSSNVLTGGATSTIYAGASFSTGAGLGFMVINEVSAKATLTAGVEYSHQWNSSDQTVHTVTTTEEISTSDGADFVGAVGDVFIGTANNMVFGTCHNVIIKKDEQSGEFVLTMEDGITAGEEFSTGFNYTQNYIENVLIPNFETLRNALITPVADVYAVERPAAGKDPIYVSTLDPESEYFGLDNDDEAWGEQAVTGFEIVDGRYVGPSYAMIFPVDYLEGNYQDMVKYYNTQRRSWITQLANNEEMKLKAIENRGTYFQKNYSFDAGASITASVEESDVITEVTEHVNEVNVVLSQETGYQFSGVGLEMLFEESTGYTHVSTTQDDSTHVTTMSYTLAEDGDDDYLSVDVFDAPDGFGPIFSTRAGATCAPYEDEVVTHYYRPGTTLSAKTLQIEKPEISIRDAIVTGVPAGGDATFRVALRNNSDTQEDCYFGLCVMGESNPDGAQIFIDGQNLGSRPELLVPYGETVKTFTLRQSDVDVLNYEDIVIRMYSTSQPDDTGVFPGIYSEGTVSVYFQPICSNISLSSNTTVVNTDTEVPVLLSISDYNYNMASLQGVRLQYKGENDAEFRTLQEYTKDEDRLAADPSLLPLPALTQDTRLTYSIDLCDDSYADQTYVFRAITICSKGGTEVNNESDEISIVRDMTRPTLIATPRPTNGILTAGDDIVVEFNEDIRHTILGATENFTVTARKNEAPVTHQTAVALAGEATPQTEATIDLAGKSWTFDLWTRLGSDGRLLAHGTKDNGMTVDVTDGGHLTVGLGGTTVTSAATLPLDKWIYLHLSYDNSGAEPVIDAGFAADAATTTLFYNEAVPAYDARGPITLGGTNAGGTALTAQVHDLSLWNKARTLPEAQADMYTTKGRYTTDLTGYWPMTEGHGTAVADQARGRSFLLPSENAWWTAVKNYALTLDGQSAAEVDLSALSQTSATDYVIEGWWRAEATQTGAASLLSLGNADIDLRLNEAGQLELAGKEAEPITWSVLVDRNTLTWAEPSVSIVREGEATCTFTVDILNASNAAENWTLTGLPAWLTASAESGTLAPLGSATLRFTVTPDAAIGTHEAAIALTGNAGVPELLAVTARIKGEAPDWVAQPDECTMNVVGQLVVDGAYSADEDDMVAAFRAGTCIGVAQPRFFESHDAYLLLMNVYGNSTDEGSAITYKVYDAGTGRIYPAVAVNDDRVLTFRADTWVGAFNAPVIFTPEDKIEQTVSAAGAGWKWMSLYATPASDAVADLLADAGSALSLVKDYDASASCDAGNWTGSLKQLVPGSMYKVKVAEPFSLSIVGAPVRPADHELTLQPGWTWLGYTAADRNSLAAALADAAPMEGDVMKSQTSFAIYTGGAWLGSLEVLMPGEGYNYYSGAAGSKTFRFATPAAATASLRLLPAQPALAAVGCEDNMNLVAVVMDGDEVLTGTRVIVTGGEEVRGVSEDVPVGRPDGTVQPLHFLTVGGHAEGELLRVTVTTAEGETYLLREPMDFAADALRGTPDQPCVLQLQEATGIDGATDGIDIAAVRSIRLYDYAGRLLMGTDSPQALLTVRDLRSYPAGIYYQQIVLRDGTARIVKLMK